MYNDIIYDNHYQGIPLSNEHGPYVESWLANALATIEGLMNESHWVIASCMALKSPEKPGQFNWHLGNNPVPEFVKKMQQQARWKHTQLHKKNPRRKKPIVDAIWQKGCTEQGNTFYRVILLLNWEAYHEQSIGFDAADTLQYRARMAWAKAMQIPENQSAAYIRFPNREQVKVENTAEGLFELFPRVSTLCTVPDDQYRQAFSVFGSTRHAPRHRTLTRHG